MQLFRATFEAVAVFLGTGLVGFALVSRRVLPGSALAALSALALDLALPCLIFTSITRHFDPGAMSGWWQLPLWWAGFTSAAFAAALLLGRISRPRSRTEFTATLFYQNGTFLPLIVLPGICPRAECQVALFLFTIPFSAFFFGTAPRFFRSRPRENLIRKILNPAIVASVLAVAVRLTGTHVLVPAPVLGVTSLLGQMAAPLIMLVLGGSLYVDMASRPPLQIPETVKFVVAKNILFPSLCLAFLTIFRIEPTTALILLLQSAVPPITAMPLLARRCGGDATLVTQFVLASFLVALVSLPAAVAVFSILYTRW